MPPYIYQYKITSLYKVRKSVTYVTWISLVESQYYTILMMSLIFDENTSTVPGTGSKQLKIIAK